MRGPRVLAPHMVEYTAAIGIECPLHRSEGRHAATLDPPAFLDLSWSFLAFLGLSWPFFDSLYFLICKVALDPFRRLHTASARARYLTALVAAVHLALEEGACCLALHCPDLP